jgi:hypothetical protein
MALNNLKISILNTVLPSLIEICSQMENTLFSATVYFPRCYCASAFRFIAILLLLLLWLYSPLLGFGGFFQFLDPIHQWFSKWSLPPPWGGGVRGTQWAITVFWADIW